MGRLGQAVPQDVCVVRADRSTELGNPYDMEGDERQRDPVCAAHIALLQVLDIESDGPVPTQAQVEAIGREWGVTGRIRAWNGRTVRRYVRELRTRSQSTRLRLDCHCAPLRCHCEALAALCETGAYE